MRNIFNEEELQKWKNLESLSSYYDVFLKFVKIFILLDNSFARSSSFDRIIDEDLKDFCENSCAECSDFEDLFDKIERF